MHLEDVGLDWTQDVVPMIASYRETLTEDRQELFDRFEVVDVARKVVGVGSVGTRCWVALLEGPDHREGDRLILQVKEAQDSVLEPYVGASALGHNGLRVVTGQRLTQAASDMFLGWSEGPRSGREYYVRQLWDVKGQGDLEKMDFDNLTYYGALCAWALALAPMPAPEMRSRSRPTSAPGMPSTGPSPRSRPATRSPTKPTTPRWSTPSNRVGWTPNATSDPCRAAAGGVSRCPSG